MIRLLGALILGLLIGFNLWGLEILPKTTWRWSFGEPIEMSGNIANPILVRLPSGIYFLIMEYEVHDDYWYLYDYMVYADGHWSGRNNQWPLTLRISDSYEIFMLPRVQLNELGDSIDYIPSAQTLKNGGVIK